MRFAAVSEALMEAAHLADGQEVLELACGTGEPGIPAAKRIGSGRVTGIDLADDMLAVAAAKARSQGVANYETLHASALALPFPDSRFDAVLCRWGIMFFPEPLTCLRETLRVLKTGGFASFATWNVTSRNLHLSMALESAVRTLGLSPPAAGAPGPFCYTDPAKLTVEMTAAGFSGIRVEETMGDVDFDSPEHYWEYASELVGAFRAALQRADPAARERAKAEVLGRARAALAGGRVHTTFSSWVVSGRRA